MKLEHRLLLAMALFVLVVLGMEAVWPTPPPKPKPPATDDPGARLDPGAAPGNGGGAGNGAKEGPAGAEPAEEPEQEPEGPVAVEEPAAASDQELVSGRIHTVVHARGASLGKAWLRGIPALPGSDSSKEEGALRFLEEGGKGLPGALSVTVSSRDFDTLDLAQRVWERKSPPGELPLVYETPVLPVERERGRNIFVRVAYHPAAEPDAFHLRVEVSLRSTEPEKEGQQLHLRVRGAALVHAPEEGSRDILYGRVKVRKNSDPENFLGPAVAEAIREKEPKIVLGDVEWAATTSTYFAAILDPRDPPEGEPSPALEVRMDALVPPSTEQHPRPLPQPSPVVVIPGTVPKEGAEWRQAFTFYCGPTADEVRFGEAYAPVMDRPEYEGYKPVRDPGWFDRIGQLLFWILKAFHAVAGNWGVAIVLLTVVVRGALMPLSRKQMKSTLEYSRKMQKIKPKLDALKERYRNNKQKLSQEQFRIMKENDVPLMPGGCLLTFLQLPIWIALYSMLQYNYDLRHASFLWVDDLSQADHLWHMLPGVRDIPLVPNSLEWLNLLPLVMTASWFFASKATMTQPADEQQAQMQAMMKYMPFVMLLFPGFYTMPAGLCLYITASSAWGIVESRIVRKKFGEAKP